MHRQLQDGFSADSLVTVAWLFWAAVVVGQEMEPPPVIASGAVPMVVAPVGSPVTVTAPPGADLPGLIAGLPAGSTLVLEPGRHAGPLVVDRPLRIVGNGARLVGPGRGTVLAIVASDSVVSNLTITGGGRDAHGGDAGVLVRADRVHLEGIVVNDVYIGIDLQMANDAVVENCVVNGPESGPMGARGDGIRLWESSRNTLRGNTLHRVRDMVVWYSAHNLFLDNRVEFGRYGIHFMHADDNRVINNALVDNVVGVFAMYSNDIVLRSNELSGANGAAGMGFGCKESDRITVQDNRVVANTTGIYLDGCPHRVDGVATVRGNLLAYNHAGLRFHQVNTGVEIRENDFYENGSPVVVDGGGTAALARFTGNRWSEYEGYDLDADGVGDLPYAPALASRGLVQRRPVAAYFSGTPAAMLLDFLGAAFPMLAPRALFSDAAPRMGRT